MGEGALLAKHCFASARTHSRQRLGRAPEGDLQRPLQPDPPRRPTECMLLLRPLLLRLPASGRHCGGCRVQPGRKPPIPQTGNWVVCLIRCIGISVLVFCTPAIRFRCCIWNCR
ncbi:hypothetical protein D7Y44_04050 [Stenotrophomonas maltophilia]|nr:hypothetical protein [Stenotrophomonas maltophilia]MBA0343985.1 hypothetical protein [Stenotrophomonas maltophilia]MBA0356619.1 hypothetical protein [Stenotrophomonas maltophilia]MBA0518098.1 hypothetical protein [Stenotrophomonas maltophilia]